MPIETTNLVDKETIRRVLDAVHLQTGFVPVPNATAEMSRASARADGVLPEDNSFSCGILAARDEE